MPMPFRGATVSVYAHATEDENKVLKALRAVLPEDIEIRRSNLKGHHGNPITSLNAVIDRKPALREFWKRILANLRRGDLDKLRERMLAEVDDSCRTYLRFDKQHAYGGELVLTTEGDSIHVKLKILAFPAKREIALALIQQFIEEGRH
ncbi:MAG TPA: exosome subunit, partial [Hadesarchaea archaeon]|nr:exosome subunit [Hadesarchaea archaeon]